MIAAQKKFDTTFKNTECEVKWTGTYGEDKNFQYGGKWTATHEEGIKFKANTSSGFANYVSGNNVGGV